MDSTPVVNTNHIALTRVRQRAHTTPPNRRVRQHISDAPVITRPPEPTHIPPPETAHIPPPETAHESFAQMPKNPTPPLCQRQHAQYW